ncbi:MAG: hypothetical protein HC905_15935, partial [Bacteroidales bacterium]|nr:hypothetical protein [Bacteroidales bacterium]
MTRNTKYYVRAYATNSEGTDFGDTLSFRTLAELPTLSTNSVTAIEHNSAQSGGNITDDGGAAITERGVCWGTASGPTITGSKTSDGTGTGSFTSNLTGLLPFTTYYARAFATNSVGTVYGDEVVFTTVNETGTFDDTRDNITYATVKLGDEWWISENLNFFVNGSGDYYDDDSTQYAADYGRLYTWEAALDTAPSSNTVPSGTQGVCPTGWHIPGQAEW